MIIAVKENKDFVGSSQEEFDPGYFFHIQTGHLNRLISLGTIEVPYLLIFHKKFPYVPKGPHDNYE